MSTRLTEGDVFKLEEEMDVYAFVPEKFAYIDRQDSNSLVKTKVTVGQVLVNEYTTTFEGEEIGPFEETYDTSQLVGQYVVTSAKLTGGSYTNRYPDGWKVAARRLSDDGSFDPDGEVVKFYQSGHFTAMNREVQPVRRLEKEITSE
jgi:hypothetical protein